MKEKIKKKMKKRRKHIGITDLIELTLNKAIRSRGPPKVWVPRDPLKTECMCRLSDLPMSVYVEAFDEFMFKKTSVNVSWFTS